MPHIPSPIVRIILLKLPTKSLVRFRCVSKSWKNTIDGQHFIKEHLQSMQKTTNHKLITRCTYLHTVDFPTLDHATEMDHPLKSPTCGIHILGSCNGLLCLSNSIANDDDGTVIYNPITKKQCKVAVSSIEFPAVDYYTGVDRMVYGFGFDYVEYDYKLVRIVQFFGKHEGYDSEVKVYSLKSRSWRRVCDFPREYYLSYNVNGVLVNGFLHWVVNESSDFDEFDEVEPNMIKRLVVAFDLVLEEFRVVELPEYELGSNLHVNVGSLNGCLYWMCNYCEVNVDVWVMEEYGVKESWTKKFSIAQPGVLGCSFEYLLPIALSKDGSNVLLHKNGDYFVWFDMQKNRVKKVDVRGMPTSAKVEVLVESLVLGGRRIRKRKILSKKESPEIAGLSTKLITKILSRLPVKSLLRFRSVSKSWRSIIDDPHFIDRHLKQSLQSSTNHTLIIRSGYLYSVDFPTLSGATEIDHPLKTPSFGTKILGSCNGLLCLSNSHEHEHSGTIIYNPATKNQQQVPVSRIKFPGYNSFWDCDPMVFGFGYDSVNDDYKLVRIIQFFNCKTRSYDSEVKIYSLKTNTWRRVRDFPHDYHLFYRRANGVYVNERFHWVVTKVSVAESSVRYLLFGCEPDESTRKYESKLIVAFDLGSEEVKVVPQPDYPESEDLHVNVGNLQGCLYLMCNYHKVCTDVWVMEVYGVKESWTKKFSISQPGILGSFEHVMPIALSKDGSNVLLSKDGKCFVWFDLKRQRAKSVHLDGLHDIAQVEVLVESLVLGSKRKNSNERKSKMKRGRKSENNGYG